MRLFAFCVEKVTALLQSPLTAGVQLIPLGIGIILFGLISGRAADKYGQCAPRATECLITSCSDLEVRVGRGLLAQFA